MNEFSGTITGSREMRAIHVAGALAEQGVQNLIFVSPDGTARHLIARETDLPGLLGSAAPGTTLSGPDAELVLILANVAWRWTTTSATLAATLSAFS